MLSYVQHQAAAKRCTESGSIVEAMAVQSGTGRTAENRCDTKERSAARGYRPKAPVLPHPEPARLDPSQLTGEGTSSRSLAGFPAPSCLPRRRVPSRPSLSFIDEALSLLGGATKTFARIASRRLIDCSDVGVPTSPSLSSPRLPSRPDSQRFHLPLRPTRPRATRVCRVRKMA